MTRIRICLRGVCWAAALALSALSQAQEPVDFHDDIFPVLEARCFKCHSDEKQKGDLRLDSPAWILRGSENGEVLTAGNAQDSPLYYLTTYDPDDPDYMPSKGEGLTDPEKELLKRWIEAGADFGDDMGGMMALSASVPPGAGPQRKYTDEVPLPPASYEMPRVLAETAGVLRAAGLQVDTANHDAAYLEVTYTYAAESAAYSFSLLEPVAASVVKLNFARSQVTDSHLRGIGRFENLSYLDLRKTAITDASLEAIGELEGLRYLNLYGTAVSDRGLESLHKLAQLRQVYLHGTNATDAGARALQQAIPGLRVVR